MLTSNPFTDQPQHLTPVDIDLAWERVLVDPGHGQIPARIMVIPGGCQDRAIRGHVKQDTGGA